MEKNTFFAITDKGKDRVSHRSKAGVTASSFCLGISALKVLGEPLTTAGRPHSLSPGSAFFFLIARRPPNASDIYCLSPPPATPQAGILFGFPAVSPGPRTALALSRPSINSCLGPTHDCMHILSTTSPRGGPGRDWHHSQGAGEETEAWSLSNSFKVTKWIEGQELNHQHWLKAIQHPADEKLQEKAWGAVVPLVGKLKKFYEFSQRLEAALRGLLGALTSTPYSPTQHLEREQALAKQFAEILHFTLRFDELKMTNPAIQNDFSYYRRTLSRMRINNVPAEGENEVNNELANRMSLFYAEATPMLKTLSDATTKFVSENKNLPIENTTDCLSTMASVCRVMLETPEYRSRFTNEETVSFCLRVMVGVIILYDHVHPVGAFAKTSKIDMKGCIKVLKDQPPNSVEGLLNALRYTTKHLNDETTSKQIKSMLQ
ncbi:CYFIP-related Rac1 interactor B isoform X1 [Equus caballus]|uniref:CYFIP-related Rac1 interactor B isoform X1 n=1 Tax=Equus caballus TaxID=9796 RepID=UPI0038B3EC8D